MTAYMQKRVVGPVTKLPTDTFRNVLHEDSALRYEMARVPVIFCELLQRDQATRQALTGKAM